MQRFYMAAGLAALALGACMSAQPYRAAPSSDAQGYLVQPIEANRYRVSYTALSPEDARRWALRRAAEVTLETGADWFRVVSGYTDREARGRTGSSVTVGGSSGRYGSGVGVGVGFGIPLGGSQEKTRESLEIITGSGPKPDAPDAYDARSVLSNTAGPA